MYEVLAMPSYRFRYAGDPAGPIETSITHEFEASDDRDAYHKKDEYLESISGSYRDKSMQVLCMDTWEQVPELPHLERPTRAFSAAEAEMANRIGTEVNA